MPMPKNISGLTDGAYKVGVPVQHHIASLSKSKEQVTRSRWQR